MSELFEDPAKVAKREGLNLVLPKDSEIFVDIDDEADYLSMKMILGVLQKNDIDITIDKETISKSGNNHVYLSINRTLTPLERVCLQACLGSDRKREVLSLLRIWIMPGLPPTTFFEVALGLNPVSHSPILDVGEDTPF